MHQTFKAVLAILFKDGIQLRRHGIFLAFQTLFPIVVLVLFYCSIGRSIESLNLSVVNKDNPNCDITDPLQIRGQIRKKSDKSYVANTHNSIEGNNFKFGGHFDS